ncbi:MerR family transcriptional regulator [Longispora fulva]|uniref:DNA-binding transcriptional MerR regulator n=1 Tax=Longispora fulva TaxID=619741 RepID=A0A8J7GGC6_9ACTN|nr:MerR family transcriptional regulator [Longispora fulva]MBG6136177.1 DNA-binding transcriptional MerR regulator [Longispora fulva]GIG63333.1 MerR family transcriptional regulator [Longispora fulva]
MIGYSPSEAAEKSGFSLDTLRYYEKIGLLADIDRTSGGRRTFSDDDLGWLALLRCLRDTGMPIARMCRFAELARADTGSLAERIALLEEHAVGVAAQLDLLLRQQRNLQDKIAFYRRQAGD